MLGIWLCLALEVAWLVTITASAPLAHAQTAQDARSRVDYHLLEIDQIIRHFQEVVNRDCPRFATRAEWRQHFDGEVERMTLLVAHVEQAWVEAKRTGDDGVRRAAKAPRRRLEEARVVLEKLQECASDNGASFSPMGVWARIEREAPRRQESIALPR